MKVKMDELLDAMETNCDLLQWYYDTAKDKLIMVTDDCDNSIENDFSREEIDRNEEDRFISIPTEHDIYEHSMMVSYSNKQSDEIRDILLGTLFKKGVFRRFRSFPSVLGGNAYESFNYQNLSTSISPSIPLARSSDEVSVMEMVPRVRTQTTNHHKNTLLPFNLHFLTEHNKQYKTVPSPYGDTGFIHCVHKTNVP